jgi:melanoma-associated antigen p97
MKTFPLTTLLAGLTLLVAGCTTSNGVTDGAAKVDSPSTSEFVLAFSVKDDYQSFVTKTDPLAAWIAAKPGVPTKILPVSDESASIAALAAGQADAAFMDAGAAWIGSTTFGLDAIAADVHSDGRTNYTANAWVKADSTIATIEDLRGKHSCHTGELKSAGMFAPMGYLIKNGYVDVAGLDMDDIASLQEARKRFFDESTIGGDYAGAFQCLSTGVGDVAFVKDSTWNDVCSGEKAASWCLPRDAYRTLPAEGFAQVPSHPVMVAKTLSQADRDAILAALLALNEDEAGRAILKDVLNTKGITAVTTDGHLGSYGEVLEHLPGIKAYLEKQKVK